MATTRKPKAPKTPTGPTVWYHVIADGKAWGFAAVNGFVVDYPREQSWMLRQSLQETRPVFLRMNAKVIEIKTYDNGQPRTT